MSYQHAIKPPKKQEWLKAMRDELKTMSDRNVWRLVKKPNEAKTLGCRWVFTIKRNNQGKIERYKARLVAQGFRQKKGETFEEVFSPVVNFGIIRFFFALLVSLNKWTHLQCDVKCAYLYAPLKENILMKQPPGFEKGTNMVCKLEKAIYGLHQSGREWFFEIHRILGELGFRKLSWCNCAYRYKNDIVLLLYVDDIVVFGRDEKQIKIAIEKLKKFFDLKILGKTKKLLGVEFEEQDGNILIHQHDYILKVCETYEEYRFPVTSLPIAKGIVYSKQQCPKTDSEVAEMKNIPYRNLIGCLAFLAGRTRPDISYAVNIYSQYQENPGMPHWNGLLKLLGYVKYTKDLRMNLSQINQLSLTAFSDADFANNKDDRTSMGGQIVFLDQVPITWRSFKQKSIALSSMESEFIALTEAAKEITWLHRILTECVDRKIVSQKYTLTKLLADNQACIDFSNSPIENNRTKHIDVKLFFIRDLIYQKIFKLEYVQSKLNLADIFTKPLTKLELQKFRNRIFQ